ncbi:MAG: FliA/WhiG family RNA polymerase sigma factor [Actinomycetota bacterium]
MNRIDSNAIKVPPKVTSGPTIELATAPDEISGLGNSTDNPDSPPVPDTLADCYDVGDLWPYYKATADPYARERLILHYAPLVKFVAGRIGSGLPGNIDQGDLIADGMFGLFDAIEKFDPSRANKFETYAIQRVKGAIYDRLRTLDWVPRSVRTKMKAVDRAHQVLEASLQRTPTDLEVAGESGLTMRELRGVYKHSSRTAVLSLDEHIGHSGNTSTLGEMLIRDEHVAPSDRIEDSELKHELRKTVLQLHEKDRIVITLYYFEGLTLSEIGRVLGVTESRACQLHGRAIASLRAHMSAHV